MTKEKAIKHLEVIKGDCALVGDICALDMAISALSADGEYIKKEDAIRAFNQTCDGYIGRDKVFEYREKIRNGLQTYSFPDSAEDNTMEWIPAKVGKLFPSNDYKCSKCGNILDFDGVNCGRGDANFCPNCGRKAVNNGNL